MSLARVVFLGSVICGWMALAGWVAAEVVVHQAGPATSRSAVESEDRGAIARLLASDIGADLPYFCGVGAAIGAGLGLAGGLANARLAALVWRMIGGLIAGGIGGVLGGIAGGLVYSVFQGQVGSEPWWLRPVGWMIAGTLIGLGEGTFSLSMARMRNGLIGGLIGGLVGGLLFDPILGLGARSTVDGVSRTFPMTGAATGFVALGLSVGASVGMTNLLLKNAWLTVKDGDRPGRQVILSHHLTIGNDPGSGLPFSGESDRFLSTCHLTIDRERGGAFVLHPGFEDADAEVIENGPNGRTSMMLKDHPQGIVLRDNQIIVVGRNMILFNEKSHKESVLPSIAPGPAPVEPVVKKSWISTPVPNPNLVITEPPEPPRPEPRPNPAPAPAPTPARVEPARLPPRPAPGPAQPRVPTSAWQIPTPNPATRSDTPAPGPGSTPAPTPGPNPSRTAAPPGPSTTSRPPAPAPSPAPTPSPAPVKAPLVCPSGHQVPPGRRYCFICDEDF